MRSLRPVAAFGLTVVLLGGTGAVAQARSLIKQPGAHPHYSAEVEPHLLVHPFAITAFGPGVRASFVLKDEGFIARLNDSVALGVGFDWLGFGGRGSRAWVPVVMQWNFWFTESLSVLAEPGGGFTLGGRARAHPVLYGGLRWLFASSTALVVRAGYPNFSVGVSFHF